MQKHLNLTKDLWLRLVIHVRQPWLNVVILFKNRWLHVVIKNKHPKAYMQRGWHARETLNPNTYATY